MKSTSSKKERGWTFENVAVLIVVVFFCWFIFSENGFKAVLDYLSERKSVAAIQKLDPNLPDEKFFSTLSDESPIAGVTITSRITANGRYSIEVLDSNDSGNWLHESDDLGTVALDRLLNKNMLFKIVTMVGNRVNRVESIRFTYRITDSNKRTCNFRVAFSPTNELIGITDPQEFKRIASDHHVTLLEDTCSGLVFNRRCSSAP